MYQDVTLIIRVFIQFALEVDEKFYYYQSLGFATRRRGSLHIQLTDL